MAQSGRQCPVHPLQRRGGVTSVTLEGLTGLGEAQRPQGASVLRSRSRRHWDSFRMTHSQGRGLAGPVSGNWNFYVKTDIDT